jgi:hypothetical protein
MQIWMAMDPETRRVLAQLEFVERTQLPPGLRGDGWPVRTTDINASLWTRMMHAGVKPETQDRLHREWWDQARAEDEPLWSLLPGESEWQPSV